MIIKEKIGNLNAFDVADKSIDFVIIEWFEVNKRIQHKRTKSGREIILKFMNDSPSLTEGDVLHVDGKSLIAVEIQPCDSIIIQPSSMYQMATVCYEIGNKHLPLFFEKDEILVPYEAPLFKLLSAAGYELKRENKKLLNQLRTTVSPHTQPESKPSLFSKILQFTTSSSDV